MATTGFVAQTKNPAYPSHETDRSVAVADYLVSRNFLQPNESVLRAEPVQARSRNRTMRVVTTAQSLIVKRFEEWADHLSAGGLAPPSAEERFRSECQFYSAARIGECVGKALPALLHQDAKARTVILSDVEAAPIEPGRLAVKQADALAWFLASLHHRSQSVPLRAQYGSAAVVQWQAARLCGPSVPENGRRTRPGGHTWLARLREQGARVNRTLDDAREALAAGGRGLVHGDFTPGNWLVARDGLYVVDAELSFFGPPEFDVASFFANLILAPDAQASLQAADAVFSGGCMRYESRLIAAFLVAQLCAGFDAAAGGETAPRGSAASALMRRMVAALEQGTIEPLLPRRPARRKTPA